MKRTRNTKKLIKKNIKKYKSHKNVQITNKENKELNNVVKFTDTFKDFKINFTAYNQGKLPDKKVYNLFSVCYFVMKNSDTLQKSKKYVKNLEILIKDVKAKLPHFKFRIYCDNMAYNKLSKYHNDKKIEFFVYEIPILMDKEGYHTGYIGTILRYFPLFDMPRHKADMTVCFDIDNKIQNDIIYIIKNELKKINFIFHTHSCYHTNIRFRRMGQIPYAMIGNFLAINSKKLLFPKYLLTDFFQEYLINDNLHYNTYIKLFLDYEKKQPLILPDIGGTKKMRPHIMDKAIAKYIFGIDEYFLNVHVRKYLLLKKIPVYYHTFYSQLSRTYPNFIINLYKTNNIDLSKIVYNIINNYKFPIIIKNPINITDNSNLDDYYIYFNTYFTNVLRQYNLNNKNNLPKIMSLNKELVKFIDTYNKELGYDKFYATCIIDGLKHNYKDINSVNKILYTKENTDFSSYTLVEEDNDYLKDKYDINKQKYLDYVASNNFMKFKS